MALGEKLCNARLALKETTSEVAAATRMKVQTVEDIEREDFRRIPAAIYAKGFIRLYAEHVGLDPAPLVAEYMTRFATPTTRSTLDPSGHPRVQKILHNEADEDLSELTDQTSGAKDLFDLAAAAPERGAPEPTHFDPEQRQPPPAPSSPAPSAARSLEGLHNHLVAAGQAIQRLSASAAAAIAGLCGKRSTIIGIGVATVAIAIIAVVATILSNRPTPADAGAQQPAPPAPLRLAVEPRDPYIN